MWFRKKSLPLPVTAVGRFSWDQTTVDRLRPLSVPFEKDTPQELKCLRAFHRKDATLGLPLNQFVPNTRVFVRDGWEREVVNQLGDKFLSAAQDLTYVTKVIPTVRLYPSSNNIIVGFVLEVENVLRLAVTSEAAFGNREPSLDGYWQANVSFWAPESNVRLEGQESRGWSNAGYVKIRMMERQDASKDGPQWTMRYLNYLAEDLDFFLEANSAVLNVDLFSGLLMREELLRLVDLLAVSLTFTNVAQKLSIF